VEIDFSGIGGRPQPGWNLFDVAGLHPAQLVGRATVIAESFLAACGWDRATAPRATNLLMQAAQSLIESPAAGGPGVACSEPASISASGK
jgi:hypothetical protein